MLNYTWTAWQWSDFLPSGLTRLDCSLCIALERLPGKLPDNMRGLGCTGCMHLEYIPRHLPVHLETLLLRDCAALRALPLQLPPNLQTLDYRGCTKLRDLPLPQPLPATLAMHYGNDGTHKQKPRCTYGKYAYVKEAFIRN